MWFIHSLLECFVICYASGFFNKDLPPSYPSTGIDEETLDHIGMKFSTNPEDLTLHGGSFTPAVKLPYSK